MTDESLEAAARRAAGCLHENGIIKMPRKKLIAVVSGAILETFSPREAALRARIETLEAELAKREEQVQRTMRRLSDEAVKKFLEDNRPDV